MVIWMFEDLLLANRRPSARRLPVYLGRTESLNVLWSKQNNIS